MGVMDIFGSRLPAVLVALAIMLGLLGVFAAMALFARNYIKVPPSTVAIFYGRKHTFTDERATAPRSASAWFAAAPRCGYRCSSRSGTSRSTSSRSR